MSVTSGTRASELAAQQVEQIVAAAQQAADEIRREAREEQIDLRRWAEEDCDELRKEARRDAERMIEKARKQALLLGTDARREGEALLEDARKESARIREQTQRAVEGRVASAEKAAADVLEEARTLTSGLRQLGKSLEDHAERILRDVTAAHKRMQAELRVAGAPEPAVRPDSRVSDPERPLPARPATTRRSTAAGEPDGPKRSDGDGEAPRERPRRNRLDDLEVPSWVAQSR